VVTLFSAQPDLRVVRRQSPSGLFGDLYWSCLFMFRSFFLTNGEVHRYLTSDRESEQRYDDHRCES
jgi:hypothetical protein